MRRIHILAGVCFSLMLSTMAGANSPGFSMKDKDGDTYILSLRYSTQGCVVELSFNDFPVAVIKKTTGFGGQPLNKWMRPGANTLKLMYKAQPNAKSCQGSFKIELSTRGAYSGKKIWSKIWKTCPPKPTLKVETITLKHAPTLLVWKATPKPKLSPSDKKAIYAKLKKIHQAYQAKNLKKIMALYKLSIQSSAAAFGLDASTMTRQLKTITASALKEKDFTMYPLAPQQEMVFKNSMGGRLVEVRTNKGEVPLRSSGIEFRSFFSYYKGVWVRVD
ncbi:MAG: hypothetical protein EP343_02810 [Deltaproteobacteria bacterium]|nr:MAG: hypothetical protein EP343_02810 [Deltaproteobacteria bacterium]